MCKSAVLCAVLAIALSGLVAAAPAIGPQTFIKYYDETSDTGAVPIRTPLRIVAEEPVKPRGSITYLHNEIDQPNRAAAPQRLTPISKQRITRIRPVAAPVAVVDPVQLSLSQSPLRLIPVKVATSPEHKYFGQSNYVDDYVEPLVTVKADDTVANTLVVATTAAPIAPAVHYKYETSFGDDDWAVKSKVPEIKKVAVITKNPFKADDSEESILDKLIKDEKYRLKSAEGSSEDSDSSDSDSSDSSSSEEDGNSSSSSSSEEDSEEEENGAEKSGEEEKDEGNQQFPVNYYTQYHNEAIVKHQPAPQNDFRINEKISAKKTGIVYSEQGYNDKAYEHGKYKKLYEVHQRYRRDVSNPAPRHSDAKVTLNKVKNTKATDLSDKDTKSNMQSFSKYVFDDKRSANDRVKSDNVNITSFFLNSTDVKHTHVHPVPMSHAEASVNRSSTDKYPFLQHNPVTALRYAESSRSFPAPGISYYSLKKAMPCDAIDVDLVSETEFQGQSRQGTGKDHGKRRLKNLGRKIDCLKKRNFGENPLDNPLFAEEFDSENSTAISFTENLMINSKLLRSLGQTSSNPSVNVYDDVISNIRSTIVAERELANRIKEREILKLKPKVATTDSDTSESSSVNKTVTSSSGNKSKGSLLDISKSLPKFPYESNGSVQYRIKHKSRKNKKRVKGSSTNYWTNSKQNRHSSTYKDYATFPSQTDSDSRASFTNVVFRKKSHPYRSTQSYTNSDLSPPHRPPSRYSYPALAERNQSFHYGLHRSTP